MPTPGMTLCGWSDRPCHYWQLFIGKTHLPPIDTSSVTLWSKRLGEEAGMEELPAQSIKEPNGPV